MMKKMVMFLCLSLGLMACGTKKENNETNSGGSGGTASITEEVRALVQEISVIDCEMYVRIASDLQNNKAPEDSLAIRELRQKKIAAVSKLTELVPDAAGKSRVRAMLDSLKSTDNYCPELKKKKKGISGTRLNGSTEKELHIRKDAQLLADLNCRIMEAHEAVKKTPADRKNTLLLAKLKEEKRRMKSNLINLYGAELISNKTFMKLVSQAQEAQCHFSEKALNQKQI
jgi:hypothetical protein